jgi:hypothetical protein
MKYYRTKSGLIAAATLPALWFSAGCGVNLDELLAVTTVTSPNRLELSQDAVLIRFRNLTGGEAVDVSFHATNAAIGMLPDDLFSDGNLVTANIGVAGTGIVQPLQEDIIDFPCTSTLTIGTQGGTFLDNNSGEVRGAGPPRWAQEGPLSLCGRFVTFVFSKNGEVFQTDLIIGG